MARKKPSKVKIDVSPGVEAQPLNLDSITQSVRDQLAKSVRAQTVHPEVEKKYDKSKVTYSSRLLSGGATGGIEAKGWQRISDQEQKQLAQVDPYISAIISTRCNQGAIVGRVSASKFDKGTRVSERKPLRRDDFGSIEEFKKAQAARNREMAAILSWVMTCGTTDHDIINSAFATADKMFKFCTFAEFVCAQIRNLLTFGRCATQVFRNSDGVPVMFRPVPVETIYIVDPTQDISISRGDDSEEQSHRDVELYNQIDEKERPIAYVQRIDGRNVNFFTEDDLHVWHFQKQALFDLNGYPLSPIEMAIYMIFVHQNTLGYLRNHFVKGLASKGIVVIQSVDPAAQLSDEDMENIRNDFHNYVTRTDNSATVPFLSGPIDVKFLNLSPTPRDMEWLQVEEHVVRALCSAFQISPQEMGYGHLSIGQGGITQANKQEEIVRGEERGLRALLDIIYDGVNNIIWENFPEAKDLYELRYVGVGEETRDAALVRQQQEMQTTATMSSLWADSEKTDTVPYGGNVPLNPAFHTNVVRYMKYGVFMESFFGEEGASSKPEYDFIIDPQLNAAYQQLRVQPIQMQQEQAKMQMAGQEMQLQSAQQPGLPPGGEAQEAPQPQDEGGAPEQQGEETFGVPQEGAEKSMADEYRSREVLQKSLASYMEAWMDAHNSNEDS